MSEKSVISSADLETLSKVIQAARIQNDNIMDEFSGRTNEIEELENEIISKFCNSPDITLSQVPDHVQCQVVMANAQRMLSRITEIHNGSLKNIAKLSSIRQMLLDAILPLLSGGSAEMREAKARGHTEGLNFLLTLEEGLAKICESTQKNLKTVQEIASRQLKAFELDLTYFSGQETFGKKVANSKARYIKE